MNFRTVKYHSQMGKKVVKNYQNYLEATEWLALLSSRDRNLHWIEGKIDGEWYGLA